MVGYIIRESNSVASTLANTINPLYNIEYSILSSSLPSMDWSAALRRSTLIGQLCHFYVSFNRLSQIHRVVMCVCLCVCTLVSLFYWPNVTDSWPITAACTDLSMTSDQLAATITLTSKVQQQITFRDGTDGQNIANTELTHKYLKFFLSWINMCYLN